MNVRYRVDLSQIERTALRALLSGGKHASRKLKRAQILLALDAGAGDEAIARDEAGVTLVELAVATATLMILFAMTIPIVDTLFSTVARVNNTYINVNQLLPVSTNLQRFMRSAVEPGPTTSGVPVPAFVTGHGTMQCRGDLHGHRGDRQERDVSAHRIRRVHL